MSEIKLLPCPFCGGEAKTQLYCNGDYVCYCKKCGTQSPRFNRDKDKAIAFWNTRKPMDKIVEQLEEKALVKECDVGTLVPASEKIVILSDAIEIVRKGGEKDAGNTIL